MAGPQLRGVQLQIGKMDPQVPALVPLRIRPPDQPRRAEVPQLLGELVSTVLVTGSAGFIGGYVVEELLGRGHEVIGVDNFSKYGPIIKSYDDHPRYRFIEGDARDVSLMTELL